MDYAEDIGELFWCPVLGRLFCAKTAYSYGNLILLKLYSKKL